MLIFKILSRFGLPFLNILFTDVYHQNGMHLKKCAGIMTMICSTIFLSLLFGYMCLKYGT